MTSSRDLIARLPGQRRPGQREASASERDLAETRQKATTESAVRDRKDAGVNRSFLRRYGEPIVGRGIATIPSLLLRWQRALQLKDGHIVLLSTVLSFYSTPPSWPSVSIEKMAKWRGVSWRRIEKEVKELEALGYVIRPGRDPRHGRSYFFDLSPLLKDLTHLAQAEGESERIRKAGAVVMEGALVALSTNRKTNRELKQKTKKETALKRPPVDHVNSVDEQKLTSENPNNNPIETEPATSSSKPDFPSAGPSDVFNSVGHHIYEAKTRGLHEIAANARTHEARP